MNRYLFVNIFFLLLASAGLHAAPVTGIVNDASGEPLVGATVIIVGTTQGTVTDVDGAFSLDASAGAKLEVAYMGYATRQVVVQAGKSNYIITLQEDTEQLEDVIVVGYGTQRRSDVTGSVASVRAADVADFSSKSLAESLRKAAVHRARRRISLSVAQVA